MSSSHPDLPNCPNCDLQATKVTFYSCCLQPHCTACFDGFHVFECKKKMAEVAHPQNHAGDAEGKMKCQRCEESLQNYFYICKQCQNAYFCDKCHSDTHGCGKFLTHESVKSHAVLRGPNRQQNPSKSNLLRCQKHKKIRNVITEKGLLVCNDCICEYKIKKVRTIDLLKQENSSQVEDLKQRIEAYSQQFWLKSQENKNKWNELKQKLKKEHAKIIQIVNERLENNLATLEKIMDYDMKITSEAIKQSKKSEKELSWGIQAKVELASDFSIFISRINLLIEELAKHKKNIQTNSYYSHKVGDVQFDKLENLLKNFSLQKIKNKDDDKENAHGSLRKSSVGSVNKLPHQNINSLASSRRSLSKSVQKNSDDLRSSTKTLKNSQDSMRKSAVIKSGKNSVFSSSHTKNDALVAKMEEINVPSTLAFDSKEFSSQTSIRTKINFSSSNTEQSKEILGEQPEKARILSNNSSMNLEANGGTVADMFNRVGKRKSDYFDLRERMRKPNVLNSRFAARK